MQLADILREHYAPLRRLSPRAVARYAITFRHFDRYLGTVEGRAPGPARLDDLTDLVVAKFVAHREAERCASTAKIDRVQLCALWRYAARKRLVAEFPELPPMRVPERIPRAYTAADLEALLAYFEGLKGKVAGVPASAWWGSLVRVLFECGSRIGETRAVRWQDVDLEARTILLVAEHRKGRTRDLVRDITPETAELLAARRQDTGPVWPWSLNENYLWGVFRRHCGRAGVAYRGFHAIRKSACSFTAAAGGDATRLADHADAATTRRHYLDPSIVKGESNLARLPRLGRRKKSEAAKGNANAAKDRTKTVVDHDDQPVKRPKVAVAREARAGELLQESALRAGFEAGRSLAAAGMAKPDKPTASMLAIAAGMTTHASHYALGLQLGFDV